MSDWSDDADFPRRDFVSGCSVLIRIEPPLFGSLESCLLGITKNGAGSPVAEAQEY